MKGPRNDVAEKDILCNEIFFCPSSEMCPANFFPPETYPKEKVKNENVLQLPTNFKRKFNRAIETHPSSESSVQLSPKFVCDKRILSVMTSRRRNLHAVINK